MSKHNVDLAVVRDFGEEWQHYDQRDLSAAESRRQFESYFAVFPWDELPSDAEGVDVGCGSGRWAKHVAPRVGKLHCVDPSPAALAVARANLSAYTNCEYHIADASGLPLPDASCDFGYSLGVLHHIPDTLEALRSCVAKLKPGAPFLVYLYYRFDNRPSWFRGLWALSDIWRRQIARMPFAIKLRVTQALALVVYWPLARVARAAERVGIDVQNWPLAQYRQSSFYMMRTDALDRFGTRLEHRFTRAEIADLMISAGLADVRFSEREPYWCACGIRIADGVLEAVTT